MIGNSTLCIWLTLYKQPMHFKKEQIEYMYFQLVRLVLNWPITWLVTVDKP